MIVCVTRHGLALLKTAVLRKEVCPWVDIKEPRTQ